jgi:hypothetical protein
MIPRCVVIVDYSNMINTFWTTMGWDYIASQLLFSNLGMLGRTAAT